MIKPNDVEYSSHGITTSKLLKRKVVNKEYPSAITCIITYREELRKTGKLVWVCLVLLGVGKELTSMCKAYEEVDHKQVNGRDDGKLKICTFQGDVVNHMRVHVA